jgi:hypothetical protein
VPLPAEQGDDAQDIRAARRAARGGGGGAPEAGEDGAEDDDGEEADVRRWGSGSPGARGGSGRKPPAFRGPTVVWRGARALADFWRPAAAENPMGQRTGGAAEGGGQGG